MKNLHIKLLTQGDVNGCDVNRNADTNDRGDYNSSPLLRTGELKSKENRPKINITTNGENFYWLTY